MVPAAIKVYMTRTLIQIAPKMILNLDFFTFNLSYCVILTICCVQVDEQPAAAGAASDGDYPAVGHLPGRARRLQQVPPLRVRCLPLPLEAGAGDQAGLPEHPALHTERANSQVARQGLYNTASFHRPCLASFAYTV